MSFDIYIGEAVINNLTDNYSNELDVCFEVKGTSLPDAPNFRGDTMTRNGNSRHPGYSQWSDFLQGVGLYDLFFNKEDGLMRKHPGCFKLNESHLKEVKEALKSYKEKNPNKNPGLCECESCAKKHHLFKGDGLPHDDSLDYPLARLEWLVFWMDWTLKNCTIPAIFNR